MTFQRQQFDASLDELRKMLIAMGERAETAIADAVEALISGDLQKAGAVVAADAELNEMEERIVETGTRLIALQQPVAKDLRRILVAFRMASDLERMADLAADIAKTVSRIGGEPPAKPLAGIARMADIVRKMTKDSIQAYMEENVGLAYQMAKTDDQADEWHSRILRDLFSFVAEHPHAVNRAMLLCFVSRYLERMADHATNIGESVVYLAEGKRTDLN